MTDAAPEPAESGADPVVQGSELIQERGEDEAVPESVPEPDAAPAEPDHKGLLHELAAMIRDIPLNALETVHVSELKAWIVSHGL